MEALSIGRRTKRYRIHLCGKCSAGLIEMLKGERGEAGAVQEFCWEG
jgi:hypothetical protein